MQQLDVYDSSPVFLRRSSLISSLNEDEDDGFLEILDDNMEVRRRQPGRPIVGRLVVTVFVPAGRLWDADGNGELAHRSVGGRQRRRGLCKLGFCSEASAGSSQTFP